MANIISKHVTTSRDKKSIRKIGSSINKFKGSLQMQSKDIKMTQKEEMDKLQKAIR